MYSCFLMLASTWGLSTRHTTSLLILVKKWLNFRKKVEFCKDEQGQPLFGSLQCLPVKVAMIVPMEIATLGRKRKQPQLKRKTSLKEHTYVHSTAYKYYLLNKFYLGESMQYFNI